MDKVLAVIPARGGSKGIPKKNLFPLCGKPLISWTIETALRAKCIHRVIVSTDDDEISKISTYSGAEVVWRHEEISGDFVPSELALIHVLDQLLHSENYQPDWVVFLQCTSPLLLPEDIDAAYEIAKNNGFDTVFSGYRQHFTGRWQQIADDMIQPINYDPHQRPMRQAIPQEILENGALYVLRPECLRQTGIRFGRRCSVYVMPLERSLQIDSVEDILLIEKVIYGSQYKNEKQNVPSSLPENIKLIIVDFDGTMTDNKVIVDQGGREQVICNRSDGWGVRLLKKRDIDIICLTSEENPVVLRRCEKLNIECINGVIDKGEKIRELLSKGNIKPEQTIFIGNDINDIPALDAVGWPVAVQDAHTLVKDKAKIILKKCGGQGVLLELAELLLKKSPETK